LEYLHTLGLRSWNGSGTDKEAFKELQCQAKQRGYNSININCTTGISDKNYGNHDIIQLFPNPVQNTLNVVLPIDFDNIELRIYNQFGQLEKIYLNNKENNISIETFGLTNGLYIIVIQNEDKIVKRKFIVNK
jgi:hypothetical protein